MKFLRSGLPGNPKIGNDWARSIDRRTIREQKTFELTPLSSSFDYTLEKDERQQALLRQWTGCLISKRSTNPENLG